MSYDITKLRWYKRCPECDSKNIVFSEQTLVSVRRHYSVEVDGKINVSEFTTTTNSTPLIMSCYYCDDCDWRDFGGNSWNRDNTFKKVDKVTIMSKKCINDDKCKAFLRKGAIYKVKEANMYGHYEVLVDEENNKWVLFSKSKFAE